MADTHCAEALTGETVRVVHVDRHNHATTWPLLREAIEQACFVGVDAELSGIGKGPERNAKVRCGATMLSCAESCIHVRVCCASCVGEAGHSLRMCSTVCPWNCTNNVSLTLVRTHTHTTHTMTWKSHHYPGHRSTLPPDTQNCPDTSHHFTRSVVLSRRTLIPRWTRSPTGCHCTRTRARTRTHRCPSCRHHQRPHRYERVDAHTVQCDDIQHFDTPHQQLCKRTGRRCLSRRAWL